MQNKIIYYRLIALWVLSETILGGIVHGLKLPVSGLIVGSSAVICICLIAYYHPVRGSILKATITVAIFKMLMSPQSPFPAYIAVFFQGLLAEIIFSGKKRFKLNCILFASIALLESGIQRLLVMTIVFGMEIWQAIDLFINGITGEKDITNYSYYLAWGYVILHFIIGLIVGRFSGNIPSMAEGFFNTKKYHIDHRIAGESMPQSTVKKRKGKKVMLILWLLLAGIYLHSLADPSNSILPSNMIFKLLFRSILIISTWVIVINPFLMKTLHRWLEKKKGTSGEEIKEISNLLPSSRFLIQESWKLSVNENPLRRIPLFVKILIYNSLRNE